MADSLTIVVNGEVQLEYDRNKSLAARQREYLEIMDTKMTAGINYNEEFYQDPDLNQRAQFVTINLIQSLIANDEQQMVAMCAYLATRLPELKQVKAELNGDAFNVDLVFDSAHQNQIKVEFNPVQH